MGVGDCSLMLYVCGQNNSCAVPLWFLVVSWELSSLVQFVVSFYIKKDEFSDF